MSCVDLPSIVAKQSFVSQTSSLGSTTIFTPSADGLFRISAYLERSSASFVSCTASWTDDYTSRSAIVAEVDSNGFQAGVGTIAIRAKSGDAISVSTSYAGTDAYDLYVVIEQLE